jgi:hypothetical protein
MALSEFESRRVEKLASEYVEAHRPPAISVPSWISGSEFQTKACIYLKSVLFGTTEVKFSSTPLQRQLS